MINQGAERFDSGQLRRKFNAVAQAYENVAALQRYTAGELLDRLEVININPEVILDLGSGPGQLSRSLAKMHTNANILQLDIAVNMLNVSRQKQNDQNKRQYYLCAEAEQLPVAAGSIDLVVSNLMLQWAQDHMKIFSDVMNVLQPAGVFVFSTLGPATLKELRSSWGAVDEFVHVNEFTDMHILGDGLVSAGLIDPVMETDTVIMHYDTLYELIQDLKELGANNINRARRKTLTGKGRFVKLQKEYETWRDDTGLPCTYEVIYGHAWKPETQGRREAGRSHTISLESLKKTLAKITRKK